ncbi:MAG: hypothetical protein A2860_03695 [Candidatus Levybacteria bacterium RIFCSPHIGHO2_01_FULL_37_33]|nr:MAG: hypothetical protein A2860_03695 [Candidatus Levybacteria bacterium RIFCSPHIGHO2_01_FULL_37_33]OGH15725.1 MAG: hypothetical protein A3C97_02005 [Candidatus Levybacteria bacterium RIFCSPHIGHO2_02_FULL_37_11]OGH29279.1 MAG: hypothetical protein A3F30_03055 [Candidatus Levybacteria bacterium RIFCSPHIGHO2_12_FULL_37_12]OGH33018.1 MAG: hypothetical protein A2953_03610 [Candidatus Levybacteria bacterium RIFCSPLOWO2_01_FULL_36_54]
MIKEFEFFHGAALCQLVHNKKVYSIVTYPTADNASYVINSGVGVYIKYSKKRLSPWRFTFKKEHQDEILEMKKRFGTVYVILVCNDDGIACLDYTELKKILDYLHEEAEWIAVYRSKREKYSIKGSDGKLQFKMGVNDFSKLTSHAGLYEKLFNT